MRSTGSTPRPRELPDPAADEPTDESAEHEPDLGRERKIGGHADENAERQAHHGPHRDRGSDAHARESTFALVQVAGGCVGPRARGGAQADLMRVEPSPVKRRMLPRAHALAASAPAAR